MEIIEIVKNRIESNEKMFNKEAIELIRNNIEVFSRVYVIGLMDQKYDVF